MTSPVQSDAVFTKTDFIRGALGQCPNCGKGHLFRAFLKIADHCDACGEEFHHHQADDFPAYLVIVFVGHLIVGLVMWAEAVQAFSTWMEVAIFLPLTALLSLILLQPTKGVVVALQWRVGMHGFAQSRRITTH
ncbi:MAG TPA: DUF983 domain-containing protein [Rhizomicrobium sp.]|jgi:uncharacterized protein (DUF983 family)|nr:DUF983 domain-containing protein [Rhizomicrobium sp.]